LPDGQLLIHGSVKTPVEVRYRFERRSRMRAGSNWSPDNGIHSMSATTFNRSLRFRVFYEDA